MDDFAIPAAVATALERGRIAYRNRAFEQAEAADLDALELAEAVESRPGVVRATRLIGLCAYRRGDSARSAEWLERARSGAAAIGWDNEELLCCNHLGGTLRKLGRLDEADAHFRAALARADPRTHLEARARLTGSYGAFLDDLGEAQAAAEHYARYEELLGLLDDPGRLANARGLVSRATRLRGDVATALAKAEDERRLGLLVKQPLREGRGWMHMAQALAAAGDIPRAEHAFTEAAALLAGGGDVRTPIEIATARGRFYLDNGRLHDAYEQVGHASTALVALPSHEHEHRAKVSGLAAEVAAAAGLHGEALWHLTSALESQLARFEPISDPRLRELTLGRRRQLAALAARLVREAGVVERDPSELSQVEALVQRLGADAPPQAAPELELVDRWRQRVREEAERRWERLLPHVFHTLPPPSQADLLLADVVSQGPVGDLSRSVFLIFATIERELGARVFEPLRRAERRGGARQKNSKLLNLLSDHRPFGLGAMVDAILQRPDGFADDDPRIQLERRLPVGHNLAALSALQSSVPCVDGTTVAAPLDHRNAIAHGRESGLQRTDVDAVRRVLTLGRGAVLSVVTGFRGV